MEHAFVESKGLLGSMKRKTSQGVSVFLKQKLAILIARGSRSLIDLTLVAPFILFEVVLLLTLFTYLPAIIRSVKKSSLPLLFSLAVFVNFVVL